MSVLAQHASVAGKTPYRKGEQLMRMRVVISMAAVVALVAGPTFAEPTVHITTHTGTVTPLGTDASGMMDGMKWQPDDPNHVPGGVRTVNGKLYDNIPTFFGGTGTNPPPTPGGLPFTWLFFDWSNPTVNWGGDLHLNGDTGVINTVRYGFGNFALTPATHIVKISAMIPPSESHATTPGGYGLIAKGPQLLSTPVFSIPGSVSGTVLITGLSIPVSGAVWLKLHDLGNPNNFWLTGGVPGVGGSHDGLAYDTKFFGTYNLWVPGPFYFGAPTGFVIGNIVAALGGTKEAGDVPTVSEWGLIGMTLLMLTAGAMIYRRRHPVAA